jgi:hypothetical protein
MLLIIILIKRCVLKPSKKDNPDTIEDYITGINSCNSRIIKVHTNHMQMLSRANLKECFEDGTPVSSNGCLFCFLAGRAAVYGVLFRRYG